MPRLSALEKETLSTNLHYLLEEYHMSIPAAALSCGISLRTFESYYYGEKGPSLKNLTKIANHFLLTPTALIGEKFVPHETPSGYKTFSDLSVKERKAYFEVKKLMEKNKKNDLMELLEIQFEDIHFSTVKMFNDLGFQIDFIPTFTYEELQDYLVDDFNLKTYNEYCELYDKRFEIVRTSNDKNLTPESKAQISETVIRLKKFLEPEREQYLLENVGLNCVLHYLDKGKYKYKSDIPLKVRISTILTDADVKIDKIKSSKDFFGQPKEFSLIDFIKFECQITDMLFDFLDN